MRVSRVRRVMPMDAASEARVWAQVRVRERVRERVSAR
jgi:hypothetical protein